MHNSSTNKKLTLQPRFGKHFKGRVRKKNVVLRIWGGVPWYSVFRIQQDHYIHELTKHCMHQLTAHCMHEFTCTFHAWTHCTLHTWTHCTWHAWTHCITHAWTYYTLYPAYMNSLCMTCINSCTHTACINSLNTVCTNTTHMNSHERPLHTWTHCIHELTAHMSSLCAACMNSYTHTTAINSLHIACTNTAHMNSLHTWTHYTLHVWTHCICGCFIKTSMRFMGPANIPSRREWPMRLHSTLRNQWQLMLECHFLQWCNLPSTTGYTGTH